jgi:hypothetical protein
MSRLRRRKQMFRRPRTLSHSEVFGQLNGLRSIGGYGGNKAVTTYTLVKGR